MQDIIMLWFKTNVIIRTFTLHSMIINKSKPNEAVASVKKGKQAIAQSGP